VSELQARDLRTSHSLENVDDHKSTARSILPDLLSAAMKVAMALTGSARIEDIGRGTIADAGQSNFKIIAARAKEARGVAC
jgi:hypothetical protein